MILFNKILHGDIKIAMKKLPTLKIVRWFHVEPGGHPTAVYDTIGIEKHVGTNSTRYMSHPMHCQGGKVPYTLDSNVVPFVI